LEDGSAWGITMPSLNAPIVAALVRAAHGCGLLTVAHVSTQTLTREAVAAGIDALAHTWVDTSPAPDIVAAIAEAQIFVVPTLTVYEPAATHQLHDDPRVISDLAPELRERLGQPLPPRFRPPHHMEIGTEVVGALHAAGVPLLAGTDAPNPGTVHGVSLHLELQLLVAAGLSPVEALSAATALPAQCFGLTDRGRIAPELRADLLLVEGDPTTNIEATLEIADVWMQGARFDRAAHRDANNL
jgi:imidazolonepropionase-like amidohydrolase